MMIDVRDFKREDSAVIDLDTGTVLGTNLVFVRLPTQADSEALDEASLSDSAAEEYGRVNGQPLFVKE